MKNSFALLYTFLAFFFFLLVSVRSDVIQDSCNKAAKGDANINFDFCVASLYENPKSKTAISVKDLVPISLDIAISKATNISSTISKLLEDKKLENATRIRLKDCYKLYCNAESSLQTAGQAFESKDYQKANLRISAALDAQKICETGFKEKKGLVSPLTKENKDFLQRTAIPLAFVSMFQ